MHLQPWMLLAVLLSAGSRLSAVDVNWLTHVVKALRTEYTINGQFCIAANIPLTQNNNKLNLILQTNSYQRISGSLDGAQVHETDDIIISKHIDDDPVHAERQVLSKISRLKRNRNGNFLLIYSYLSPCSKCTDWNHKYSAVTPLYNNVLDWEDAAFVFTQVYDKPSSGTTIPRNVLRDSLTNLGESMDGLHNVYRCYGASNTQLECHSCSSRNQISEVCISNNAGSPQISQNEGGASSSNRGRDSSSSSSNRGRDSSSSSSNRGRDSSSSSSNRGRDSSSNRGRDSSSSSSSDISNKRGRYDSQGSRSPSNQGRS